MKLATTALLGVLASLSLACPYKVPNFKLTDQSGKVYTSAAFTEKATLLVFMKAGCPANEPGLKALKALQAKLGKNVQIIGVMNVQQAEVRKQAKALGPSFPILADPKAILSQGFKATRSLQFSVVATKKEARWAKLWDGLGPDEVTEALIMVEKHGVPVPTGWNSSLPKKTIRGCTL